MVITRLTAVFSSGASKGRQAPERPSGPGVGLALRLTEGMGEAWTMMMMMVDWCKNRKNLHASREDAFLKSVYSAPPHTHTHTHTRLPAASRAGAQWQEGRICGALQHPAGTRAEEQQAHFSCIRSRLKNTTARTLLTNTPQASRSF